MTIQYGTLIRSQKLLAMLDPTALNPGGGGSPTVYIRSGSPPANPTAPITGTQLATVPIPFAGTAGIGWTVSGGVATLAGTWQDLSADGTGTAGWFYIGPPDGNTIELMGSVGASGSGADMIVDNTSFLTGQAFSILSFTLTEGGA